MIREVSALSTEERGVHANEFGTFNEFPPGWAEITEAEFAKSPHFTYAPILIEYRQMLRYMDGTKATQYVAAHLQFQHDHTGYAIVNDYWAGKIRFYKFGCNHVWGDARPELERRGERLFAMQNANFCTKCGFLGITDSSD